MHITMVMALVVAIFRDRWKQNMRTIDCSFGKFRVRDETRYRRDSFRAQKSHSHSRIQGQMMIFSS
jgi:hypothetical protein